MCSVYRVLRLGDGDSDGSLGLLAGVGVARELDDAALGAPVLALVDAVFKPGRGGEFAAGFLGQAEVVQKLLVAGELARALVKDYVARLFVELDNSRSRVLSVCQSRATVSPEQLTLT